MREAGLDAHAAYSTFNMGSGYALYCARGEGEADRRRRPRGWARGRSSAGAVEEGPRQVILEPVGVRFDSSKLELSAG